MSKHEIFMVNPGKQLYRALLFKHHLQNMFKIDNCRTESQLNDQVELHEHSEFLAHNSQRRDQKERREKPSKQ